MGEGCHLSITVGRPALAAAMRPYVELLWPTVGIVVWQRWTSSIVSTRRLPSVTCCVLRWPSLHHPWTSTTCSSSSSSSRRGRASTRCRLCRPSTRPCCCRTRPPPSRPGPATSSASGPRRRRWQVPPATRPARPEETPPDGETGSVSVLTSSVSIQRGVHSIRSVNIEYVLLYHIV